MVLIGGTILGVTAATGNGRKKKTKKIKPEDRLARVWDENADTLKSSAQDEVEDFLEEYIERHGDDYDAARVTELAVKDLVPMYDWSGDLSPRAQDIFIAVRQIADLGRG